MTTREIVNRFYEEAELFKQHLNSPIEIIEKPRWAIGILVKEADIQDVEIACFWFKGHLPEGIDLYESNGRYLFKLKEGPEVVASLVYLIVK